MDWWIDSWKNTTVRMKRFIITIVLVTTSISLLLLFLLFGSTSSILLILYYETPAPGIFISYWPWINNQSIGRSCTKDIYWTRIFKHLFIKLFMCPWDHHCSKQNSKMKNVMGFAIECHKTLIMSLTQNLVPHEKINTIFWIRSQ